MTSTSPRILERSNYGSCSRVGVISCLLWSSLLWFCACLFWMTSAGPAVGAATEPPTYLIGPGDTLEIVVRNEPSLSRNVTVRPDGRVSLPLVDDLVASGRTPEELAREFQRKLQPYLLDPRVSVTVVSAVGVVSQRIRVIGEVNQPDSLPYRSGMTLLDVMNEIGGLTPSADGNSATIVRRTAEGQEEIAVRLDDLIRDGDVSANVALLPGDIIVIPEGFFSGDIEIERFANASVTYTDNIELEPDDEKSSAFVTRVGGGVALLADLARFDGRLSSNVDLGFNSDDSGLFVDGQLIATSTTELARDRLYFDLDASVDRTVLDSRDSESASEFVPTNQDTVITLTASPLLIHNLGRLAESRWRYRISPVFVPDGRSTDSGGSSSNSSDSLTHSISNQLIGAERFQRLDWSLESRAGQVLRRDEEDIDFADIRLGLSYWLWRDFSLLGDIGYVYRTADDDDDNDELNGIAWNLGFEWQFATDAFLGASFGQRDEDEVFDANLRFQIGPRTSIQAGYRDERSTDQERFIRGITEVAVDDSGNFIDPITGLPFDPNDPVISFNDNTTRTRSLQAALRYAGALNTLLLSGRASRETGTNDDEDRYNLAFSWSRSLTDDLNFFSRFSYEREEFSADDREDDSFLVIGALSYRVTDEVSARLQYSFKDQQSNDRDEDFTENTVSLGFTVRF